MAPFPFFSHLYGRAHANIKSRARLPAVAVDLLLGPGQLEVLEGALLEVRVVGPAARPLHVRHVLRLDLALPEQLLHVSLQRLWLQGSR